MVTSLCYGILPSVTLQLNECILVGITMQLGESILTGEVVVLREGMWRGRATHSKECILEGVAMPPGASTAPGVGGRWVESLLATAGGLALSNAVLVTAALVPTWPGDRSRTVCTSATDGSKPTDVPEGLYFSRHLRSGRAHPLVLE